MVRPICLLLVGSLAVAGIRTAHAQPSQITFADALGLADQLPLLVAAREVAAAERALEVPRPWQALTLQITPQARLRPSESRGLEGGVAVQQYIPLGDARAAKRDVLARQADARVAQATAATLARRLEVAAAWIAAWTARERHVAADHELGIAREIVRVTERGLAMGVFTEPEVADAKAFLAEAELRRTDADGEIVHAGFTLARAMARPGALHAGGDLPAPPLPPATATDELLARARRMPAVAARLLSARVARARAVEERVTRGTQVILGAEIFRDEPGAMVAGLTLGVALPHDRGQREAREAELEARLADAEATQLVAQAVTELEDALHEVEHTQEVVDKLRDQLVPAADDAAARRQRAHELGESTIVELLAARRTALLARARLTDARARHAWARIAAWLLLEASNTEGTL
jgi:outer membrane protein TolC